MGVRAEAAGVQRIVRDAMSGLVLLLLLLMLI
jgi:hypothetical protein